MWEWLLLLGAVVAFYLLWRRNERHSTPSPRSPHPAGATQEPDKPARRPKTAIDVSHKTHHWKSDHFDFNIVGESHYQDAISHIARSGSGPVVASLIPESTNAYDKSAVRVDIEGRQVGYLSREDARSFRRRLGAARLTGQTTTCDAEIRGGGTAQDGRVLSYGVFLSMKEFG